MMDDIKALKGKVSEDDTRKLMKDVRLQRGGEGGVLIRAAVCLTN